MLNFSHFFKVISMFLYPLIYLFYPRHKRITIINFIGPGLAANVSLRPRNGYDAAAMRLGIRCSQIMGDTKHLLVMGFPQCMLVVAREMSFTVYHIIRHWPRFGAAVSQPHAETAVCCRRSSQVITLDED